MVQSPRTGACSLPGSGHPHVKSLYKDSILQQLLEQCGMSCGPDHKLGFCSGAEVPSGCYAHACLLQSRLHEFTPLHFRGDIQSENLRRETAQHWGLAAWSQALLWTQAFPELQTRGDGAQIAAATEVVSFP